MLQAIMNKISKTNKSTDGFLAAKEKEIFSMCTNLFKGKEKKVEEEATKLLEAVVETAKEAEAETKKKREIPTPFRKVEAPKIVKAIPVVDVCACCRKSIPKEAAFCPYCAAKQNIPSAKVTVLPPQKIQTFQPDRLPAKKKLISKIKSLTNKKVTFVKCK